MPDTERDRLAAELEDALEVEQQAKRAEAAMQLMRDQQTDDRIAAALERAAARGAGPGR